MKIQNILKKRQRFQRQDRFNSNNLYGSPVTNCEIIIVPNKCQKCQKGSKFISRINKDNQDLDKNNSNTGAMTCLYTSLFFI